MIVIDLNKISLVLGAHPIFTDLNWRIQHEQKIGLIGPNGAGKSSLLKLITGEYSYETGGSITFAKDTTIGYLAQEPSLPADKCAFDVALSSNLRYAELQAQLNQVEQDMGDPNVYNKPNVLARCIEIQERCLEEYNALGGDNYPEHVRMVLEGLGLPLHDHNKPIMTLSGGQKKLVGLAGLILSQPSVLLLDEPDNHLDINGKVFLEQLIQKYPGTIVIISHDRYLLDAVVTHICELEDGVLSTYEGDYSSYIIDKETRLARQEELYQVQQREIKRLETAMKRFAMWGKVYNNEKFAKRAEAFQKRIERIERIDKPLIERRRIKFELEGWRGSTKVLEISDLKKTFGDQILFTGLNLELRHGQRAALIGPNGAGKSLLIRMIQGVQPPDSGKITIGPSVKTGYYAQEFENINPEISLIDTVRYAITEGSSMSESRAIAFLSRYLFSYQQASQKVKELSGGERSRLQLALLVLSGANFLLLDEPTNNLDIASAEVLEETLGDFEGTILVISHDRYFIDRITNSILILDNGEIFEYPGSYSDYSEYIMGLGS